jgi:GT2 family glycosyltransferase/glycosyltransferase involved in cell wall biosynthesis
MSEKVVDLSIVVLSWNVREMLAGCLRSLPGAAGEWWARAEVVVVDNASTDGSAEMVREQFPGVRVLALRENRGFSVGNNAGIRASRGRFVLLLNPDTIARPGSIEAMCEYLEGQPDVGVVGPRLLNPDGTLQPSRRRFPTLATALVESTPLQQAFPSAEVLRRFYVEDRPDGETQDVDWLSGAALLCRRETLEQVGLFDPGYFMFSEEVDLCRRVREAGWRVVYLPGAEITHFGGQSTDQAVPSRHINFNSSKARYFRLHEGRVAGRLVRWYLLGVYAAQMASEGAKWLVGHKREMRTERLRMYVEVLRSGLREKRRAAAKKPVLLITGEFPPARGGVGDYTCRLAQAMEDEGQAVRVLTRRRRVQDISPAVGIEAVAGAGPMQVRRITGGAAERAARRSGAAVAHIQYQTGAYEMRPTVNLLPLVLRARFRGPVVVTFHDLLVPYLFPRAGPVREWANRLLALTASACVATNPEDYERLRKWGVQLMELIPIGANVPRRPPAGYDRAKWREERGLPEDAAVAAYFGFLNSTKGLDDLMRALATLREKGDYRLLMVGGGLGSSDPTNRATAEKLAALARDLGVQDRLLWTGYLPPEGVSAALLAADFAVLPYADGASFRRGSLLAALEHGLSIVTTEPKAEHQVPGWPVLVDGENALLVPPGDAGALAEAMERVARSPELRERLSAGARELAEFFDWGHIARKHLELYGGLGVDAGYLR